MSFHQPILAKRRIRPAGLAGVIAASLTLGLAPLSAAPKAKVTAPLEVDYRISLAGFPIAIANLTGAVSGGKYNVNLVARTTGLVGVIKGTKGNGTAQGSAAGPRVVPSQYNVEFDSSKGAQIIKVAFAGGNVSSASIQPPLDPSPDRQTLQESHKQSVIDPVSALVMLNPGTGPMLDPAACNRNLPIFDGAARYDVTLSYSEMRQVKLEGYQGPALVCAARYTPIAGHRSGRPGVRFMEQNRELEAWLIPVPGTRALVPVRFVIATMVGSLVIDAKRFGAIPANEMEADPALQVKR